MPLTFLFLSFQRSMCIALLIYASFYPQDLRASTLQNIPRALMLNDGGYYQGELAFARFSKFSAKGDVLWSRPFGLVYARPLAGDKGTVYVGSSNGCVYAVKSDGTVLWQTKTREPVLSDLQWGSDRSSLFVATDNGWLYALSGRDGKALWTLALGFETGATLEGTLQFSSGQNTLYLRDSHNKLYAVRVPKTASTLNVKTLNQNESNAPQLVWVRSLGE
jgi:hypothetical protein